MKYLNYNIAWIGRNTKWYTHGSRES